MKFPTWTASDADNWQGDWTRSAKLPKRTLIHVGSPARHREMERTSTMTISTRAAAGIVPDLAAHLIAGWECPR